MNKIIFNNIEFFVSHEIHQNPISIFKEDDYFKICHKRSRKKLSFKIKREFDFNLGIKMGCWECISHRQDNWGYPGFKLKGRMIKIHRFMYCIFNKIQNIDDIRGKIIRHKCDNRLCSNPLHLEIGSHQQNMQDRQNKGHTLQGSKNHFSKITEIDVLYIRSSNMSLSYLSEMYGICKGTVRRIKKRQLWKHVKDINYEKLENIKI